MFFTKTRATKSSSADVSARARAAGQARAVEETLKTLPALSQEQISALEKRIRERQEGVGYTSDYDSSIAKVTPPDLE